MPFTAVHAFALLCSFLVALDPSAARAQPAEGGPAGVELPRLLQPATVELPGAGASGTVPVLLTIDASGMVTAAEVLESRGPEIDQAVKAAGLRLRFSPARRAGEAIPAGSGTRCRCPRPRPHRRPWPRRSRHRRRHHPRRHRRHLPRPRR